MIERPPLEHAVNYLESTTMYPQCSTLVIIPGELERQHCPNRVVPGLTICSQCVERKFAGRSWSQLLGRIHRERVESQA